MISSDLPSPAEAACATEICAETAGFAKAGNRLPPSDQVRGQAFSGSCTRSAGIVGHHLGPQPLTAGEIEISFVAASERHVEPMRCSALIARRLGPRVRRLAYNSDTFRKHPAGWRFKHSITDESSAGTANTLAIIRGRFTISAEPNRYSLKSYRLPAAMFSLSIAMGRWPRYLKLVPGFESSSALRVAIGAIFAEVVAHVSEKLDSREFPFVNSHKTRDLGKFSATGQPASM
jgi:hypothetical protein